MAWISFGPLCLLLFEYSWFSAATDGFPGIRPAAHVLIVSFISAVLGHQPPVGVHTLVQLSPFWFIKLTLFTNRMQAHFLGNSWFHLIYAKWWAGWRWIMKSKPPFMRLYLFWGCVVLVDCLIDLFTVHKGHVHFIYPMLLPSSRILSCHFCFPAPRRLLSYLYPPSSFIHLLLRQRNTRARAVLSCTMQKIIQLPAASFNFTVGDGVTWAWDERVHF